MLVLIQRHPLSRLKIRQMYWTGRNAWMPLLLYAMLNGSRFETFLYTLQPYEKSYAILYYAVTCICILIEHILPFILKMINLYG